jgi:hypothetical protein
LLLAAFSPTAIAGACAPQRADPADSVRKLDEAVNLGDSASVSRLFGRGFYAFVNGQRMSGPDVAAEIDKIRNARPPYTWTVEHVDTQVACTMA